MSSDAHDRMIHAFQEYFKWQDRFHHKKSNEAGIKARSWLSEIRTQASILRVEIQDKRKTQRESRKGMRGKKL
jgi:hypothetical protein